MNSLFPKGIYSRCANILGSDKEMVQTSCKSGQEKQEEAINSNSQQSSSLVQLAAPHLMSCQVSDAESGSRSVKEVSPDLALNDSKIQILTVT